MKSLTLGWAPTFVGYSMQGVGKFGFYEAFKILYGNLLGEVSNLYTYSRTKFYFWSVADRCGKHFILFKLSVIQVSGDLADSFITIILIKIFSVDLIYTASLQIVILVNDWSTWFMYCCGKSLFTTSKVSLPHLKSLWHLKSLCDI